MNIVYLFLVYKNPNLLLHTLKRLEAPNVEFYVHIDAASKANFSCINGINNLYISDNKYITDWGG